MASWSAKDPDAVLDYVLHIPLDPEDSIASLSDVTFTQLSGTAVIGTTILAASPTMTEEGYGQDLTVWISGGSDGETNVFEAEWTTVGGRTPDPLIIPLLVRSSNVPVLALTGYAKPAPAHLIARYPAFATVSADTIQYWLTDAERSVDVSWSEGDYAAAMMALAAHNMTLAGLGNDATLSSVIPAGVSRFKSGSLDVTLTDAAADARLSGDFTATRYGQDFQALLRRDRGGPVVSSTGVVPMCGFYPWPLGVGGCGWPG